MFVNFIQFLHFSHINLVSTLPATLIKVETFTSFMFLLDVSASGSIKDGGDGSRCFLSFTLTTSFISPAGAAFSSFFRGS